MKPAIINADTLNILWRHPFHFLALGFGAGISRYAPGTLGTVMAIPIYWLLQTQGLWIYLGVVLLMLIAGIGLCGYTARALNSHDHPGIVWDEFVGFLITMIAVPSTWYWLLLGFSLFRLFDIWKPFPIKQLDQRVRGGFGVMLDDVVAGIYAWFCLWGVIWLTSSTPLC